MERNATSLCPTPTLSTSTMSKPAASHSEHRFARATGHAADVVAGRGRPDEGARLAAEILHARLVAQNAAAGTFAGGINGQHRHRLALLDQITAEALR